MAETIYALSSGLPPAGIAVIRISGPAAGDVLARLAGTLPVARRASYRTLRDPDSAEALDDALILWFPGQNTATGEDLAELHLHGGRAVVAAVLATLSRAPGLREARAGEFTRRALENGRIDLTEAEGLADLLAAETELQRKVALALAEGGLGQQVDAWQGALLRASALVEAALDFSDEGDVGPNVGDLGISTLREAIGAMVAAPPVERLRDGVRIVLAGPPNAGKSLLFNRLVGREAAIVTEIAGTTRDRIEAPVVMQGLPLLFIDTAGIRADSADPVEAIGIARSSDAMAQADLILWLGEAADCPSGALLIANKSDVLPRRVGLAVSAVTGEGVEALLVALLDRARALLPAPDALALNARHRALLAQVQEAVTAAEAESDLLIIAEHLRIARNRLDTLTGRAGVEDMLDTLFGRFCVGK